MKTKKYAGGGAVENDRVDYAADLGKFIRSNIGRDVKISDMTADDYKNLPKKAGLALLAGYGTPFAEMASGAVNTTRDLKKAAATKRQLNAMPEEFSEPVDMSTPRPPRRELNEDQKRSIAREAERRSTFGPTQDQRDRAARGMKKGGAVKMAKGGSVSSASKRADGCAVKGKTRGMMR